MPDTAWGALRPFFPGFTAFWLIGQFFLLVILYHAAPWPWASRSLSMLGALLPTWALLLHAGRPRMMSFSKAAFDSQDDPFFEEERRKLVERSQRQKVPLSTAAMMGVAATMTLLAICVAVANVIAPPGDPWAAVFVYRAYSWAYVGAQCLLAVSWYVWWRRGGPWPALGGGLLAALGTVMSAKVHGMRPVGDILEMRPWTYMWSGDHGPIDVLSRVAPKLLTIEVLVLGGASLMLAAFAWRRG